MSVAPLMPRVLTPLLAWTIGALAVLLVTAVALLAPFVAIFESWAPGPRPSDAALIENFHVRRAVLERLVAMIREDRGLKRVDDTWTDPADPATIGVSPERIALYRKLFREAGVPRGFYAFEHSIT